MNVGSEVQARLKDVHSVHGSNIAMAAIVGWTGFVRETWVGTVMAISAMVGFTYDNGCLRRREGPWQTAHGSGQIITTSADVTLNGGLIRELPQNPLNSGLGIILICPDGCVLLCSLIFCWNRLSNLF